MNSPRRWHKWNGKVDGFRHGETMPKGLDWDAWLGTASYHDYSKDYVQGEWRSWFDFGNGCLGDWGAHTFDTMRCVLPDDDVVRAGDADSLVTHTRASCSDLQDGP